MLTPLLLLVSLFTLAVAQCPCYPVNGTGNDPDDVVCNSTTLTSIPDCVASDVPSLSVWTPSIPLEAATFERFTALTVLSFAHFKTPVIARDVLKYLRYLHFFQIFNTEADYIDNEWFMFTPHITTLYLAYNRLAYLAPDTFIYLPLLNWVDLSHNQLMSLELALFQGTSIATLYLDSNPWHCDCELATFVLWMQETGVQTRSYAKCAHPDILKGLNINNLTTSLAC